MTFSDVRQAIEARLTKHDLATDAILKRFGRVVHSEPEKPPTYADVISAGRTILQVNGALKDKQQDSRITVNIGFLQPSTHTQPAISVTCEPTDDAREAQCKEGHSYPPVACLESDCGVPASGETALAAGETVRDVEE